MPICIYCGRDSSTSVSVPHVLPEALTQNRLTLPVGTECDACNAYVGNKLEPHLPRYPHISFAIQFLGAPGKAGKPRAEIGGITRQRLDPKHVRVNLKVRGRLSLGQGEKRILHGHVPPGPGFDFLRFRRALHHIGLNYVVAVHGHEVALGAAYDSARQYVKNPRPANDSWPFGQLLRAEIPRFVGVGLVEYGEAELIQIAVFQVVFLVDLLDSGCLRDATAALGGTVVEPEAKEPPIAEMIVGDR